MSDVPFEETNPNPEQMDPTPASECWECTHTGPCHYHRAELLAESEQAGAELIEANPDIEWANPADLPDVALHNLPPGTPVYTSEPARIGGQLDCSCVEGSHHLPTCRHYRRAFFPPPPADRSPRLSQYPMSDELIHMTPLLPLSPAEAHEQMLNATGQRQNLTSMFDSDTSGWVSAQALAAARADDASLRAMGAKADGTDVLFEMDMDRPLLSPNGPTRLRVILPGARPVGVELTAFTASWAEALPRIGKAMADCGAAIRRAIEATQKLAAEQHGDEQSP